MLHACTAHRCPVAQAEAVRSRDAWSTNCGGRPPTTEKTVEAALKSSLLSSRAAGFPHFQGYSQVALRWRSVEPQQFRLTNLPVRGVLSTAIRSFAFQSR